MHLNLANFLNAPRYLVQVVRFRLHVIEEVVDINVRMPDQ